MTYPRGTELTTALVLGLAEAGFADFFGVFFLAFVVFFGVVFFGLVCAGLFGLVCAATGAICAKPNAASVNITASFLFIIIPSNYKQQRWQSSFCHPEAILDCSDINSI
jgi:hypothetical protein